MPNFTVVLIDDRLRKFHDESVEDAAKWYGVGKGDVKTAESREEGMQIIKRLHRDGKRFKVLTDLSMGRGISGITKMLDGYLVARECIRLGVPPADITLHSTAFEPTSRARRINRATVMRWAKKRGITVQPKFKIFRKPPRRRA